MSKEEDYINEISCPHCRSWGVADDDYFCRFCGGGISPLPCEHSPYDRVDVIEEWFSKEDLVVIYCPVCRKRTRPNLRSHFCVDDWNNGRLDRKPTGEYVQHPKQDSPPTP